MTDLISIAPSPSPGNRTTRLVLLASVAAAACHNAGARSGMGSLPEAFESAGQRDCYNGAGFFRVAKTELQRQLPSGFIAKDGSLLGREHSGYGLLVLTYYSCPRSDGGFDDLIIVGTPVEDPPFTEDLHAVRWNWYEFARLVGSQGSVEEAKHRGLSAQLASFSRSPFHEGDREFSFSAAGSGGTLLEVRGALTDSMNFQAQSHRFWHRDEDGRLVSTRFDFGYHHSWVGRFTGCSFAGALFAAAPVSNFECTGIGITETIEKLPLTEHVVRWR